MGGRQLGVVKGRDKELWRRLGGGGGGVTRDNRASNPPDFELCELRLRLSPRFGAVDLGEVEAVRLEVDVHV